MLSEKKENYSNYLGPLLRLFTSRPKKCCKKQKYEKICAFTPHLSQYVQKVGENLITLFLVILLQSIEQIHICRKNNWAAVRVLTLKQKLAKSLQKKWSDLPKDQ